MSAQTLALAREEIPALPAYNAGLSSDAVRRRYGATHIARLASNESPFGASPAVARALANLVNDVSVYPDAGCVLLREAMAQRLGIPASHLVVGNGSESILQMLCQTFLAPGERVLVQRPAFGLHEIYPRMMGAQVDFVDLTDDLEFDTPAWCAALARSPKIAFITNPSNPVGCMFGREAFAQLLAQASPQTLLVIDEAYWEYARLEPDFPDTLDMLRSRQQPWIILRTFSKAWGLAGLRVGYGIASDPDMADLLGRVKTPFNVNAAAQMAALAAWNDQAFMEHAAAETVQRRRAMADALKALGLRLAPSAANFLFVDLGRPNGPVNEALLAEGIIVKPWKEPGFEHFIRISIGSPEDNDLCLRTLRRVIRPE